MTLAERLRAGNDAADAAVNVLREYIGDDAELTVQDPGATIAEIVGDATPRIAVRTFTAADGSDGVLALVALPDLATPLEHAASDELLVTAAGDALEAVAQAIAALAETQIETQPAHELDLAALNDEIANDDIITYPLLMNSAPAGALVIAATAGAHEPAAAPAATPVAGAPTVLAEVEMGVTAELGRCEMTVRELLSLTPGAVIDLDRAAGAPVDVLVNGTLIARGEVVVIDEEFGIRIQEILTHGAHH
jgi:flagellar motor switch protein FliN/FliY